MFYYNLILSFFEETGEENLIVFHKNIEATEAVYSSLTPPLPPKLEELLRRGKLTKLYSHQAEAINQIRDGKNIIIATKTSSGKSICYNLPIIESIMEDNKRRALYIFPTKALTRNQAARMEKYKYAFYYDDFHFGLYDGDTPKDERHNIRKKANIVITTPDMLHLGILPNHNAWEDFFKNLKYVVIDELHTYRGIFGSHMAMLIRRLRRICHHYGSDPQFICSSATVKNPVAHAKSLIQLDFEIIEKSTGSSGEKTFILLDSDRNKGKKRNINTLTSLIFYHLIKFNVRTIVFSKSRKSSEIIFKTTQDLLSGSYNELVNKITSYRGGYMPELRKKIEKDLSGGELIGVVSTSALEAGIDIGNLDACIISGFPSSIMSLWQQAGRVGRRTGASLVIIIASNSPRDQYYLHHGDEIFNGNYEEIIIDENNPYIINGHLQCAAYEFSLEKKDRDYFGEPLLPFIRAYNEKNYLFYSNDKFEWNVEDYYPAESFSLRSSCEEQYQIIDSTPPAKIMGSTSERYVKLNFHPDAIYIHQSESYKVINRDERKKKIYLIKDPVEYYTTPQITSEIQTGRILERSHLIKELYSGHLKIKEKCASYKEIDINTGKTLRTIPIGEQSNIIDTTGFWFTISEEIQKSLIKCGMELSGGLQGTGYAISSIIPIFTLCEGGEIISIANSFHKMTGKPTIFIYDRFPGGMGYAMKGYKIFQQLITKSYELIINCPCNNGCARCIQSPNNPYPEQYLHKNASLIILDGLKKEIT